MSEFRIIQTKALDQLLPFEVQEHRRVWYLPWAVWRPLRSRAAAAGRSRPAVKRFQTKDEARLCIAQRLASRARRQAQADLQQEQARARQQFPRVVEVMGGPAAAGSPACYLV